MLKFDSLYTDYQELLLDLKINAKFLTLVAPDMETLKEDVRVKYLVEQSGAEKENYRYNYSRKVSDAYEISYDTEMELQDGEELLDLWGSSNRQEFIEPSFVLKQEYIDLFAYENNPNDTERERIINSIIGDDLEEFKGGIKETERVYGSVKEQAETVLSDEQIDNLGKVETKVDASVFDDDEGIDLSAEEVVGTEPELEEVEEEIEETEEEIEEEVEEEIDLEDSDEEEIDLPEDSSDDEELANSKEVADSIKEVDASDEEEIELDDESVSEEEVLEDEEDSISDEDEIEEDEEVYEDEDEIEEDEEVYEDEEEVEEDEEETEELSEDSEDTESEEEGVVYEDVDNNVVKGVDNKDNQEFYDPTDDVSDVEMEFETTEVKVEVKEEPTKGRESPIVKQPAPVVKAEPKPVEQEAEPTNIRQFLRKHPNSDYEFVLQYFSKKEIEDSIRCGKIIKVRNKLKA